MPFVMRMSTMMRRPIDFGMGWEEGSSPESFCTASFFPYAWVMAVSSSGLPEIFTVCTVEKWRRNLRYFSKAL